MEENGNKITIKNVNAKIVWEIPNFPSHANQTEAIKSPQFEIAEPNGDKMKWLLQIYPNGFNGPRECVDIYVTLVQPGNTKVPTRIELAIMNCNGVEKYKKIETRTVNNNGGWWFPKFIKRDLLLNEWLLSNGKLTIVCHIIIERVEPPVDNIQIPPCQLTTDIANLLKDAILADFVLVSSDNKEFKAHKIILTCRSPVFAAMFQQNGMTETTTNSVKIKDIRGDVLQQMLHFIYTGNAPNIGAMAKELLAAADKYQIERLKVLCERSLALSLNRGNACPLLVLADLHSADHLKSEIIQFIASHADEVIKSDGLEILSKELVIQLFQAMASRKGKSM